jgi:hypothetical protein
MNKLSRDDMIYIAKAFDNEGSIFPYTRGTNIGVRFGVTSNDVEMLLSIQSRTGVGVVCSDLEFKKSGIYFSIEDMLEISPRLLTYLQVKNNDLRDTVSFTKQMFALCDLNTRAE